MVQALEHALGLKTLKKVSPKKKIFEV